MNLIGLGLNQFLGIWYAIQKTSTASSCLIYNVTRGEEPGEYFIEQVSQHFALGLTPLKHEYSYTGQLSVPIPELPAKMRVKFPLSKFSVLKCDFLELCGTENEANSSSFFTFRSSWRV